METLDYAVQLENRLIEKYETEFFEKTGKTLIITIHTGDPVFRKKLPLTVLLEFVNKYVPSYLKMKNIVYYNRKRELVELRHIYCKIAKRMGHTYGSIGEMLNGRDHTTALNSCTKHDNYYQTDPEFRALSDRICKDLQQTYYGETVQSHPEAWSDTERPVPLVQHEGKGVNNSDQSHRGAGETAGGWLDNAKQGADLESHRPVSGSRSLFQEDTCEGSESCTGS